MSTDNQTAGIILAAGESVRFGQTKQLVRLKEKYLVEWVLDAALHSQLTSVVLVLGHEHQKIIKALGAKLDQSKLEVIINHQYHEGQSTSLKVGLNHFKDDFSAVMYLLGDQPMLKPDNIDQLLERFGASDKQICVPVYQGQRGNPTIFKRQVFEEILQIKGDIGARSIIDKDKARVLRIDITDPLCFFDIDLPQDLIRLRALMP